jgi:hypothetical protein
MCTDFCEKHPKRRCNAGDIDINWSITLKSVLKSRMRSCGFDLTGSIDVKVKQSRYTPWRRLGGEEV